MNPEILITADNSATVFIPALNATYHSRHGAVQESRHIFIEAGLKYTLSTTTEKLKLLEIGFGTGLNAILTLLHSQIVGRCIHYTAFEKFPLSAEIYTKLDYSDFLGEGCGKLLQKIHQNPWNTNEKITTDFELEKIHADVCATDFPAGIHLVYFDAFAPSATPKLWEKPVFEKLFACMFPGAALVTFCAKGEVKRTLKQCGFRVESLPGPPGKREMTRAVKPL